MTSLQQIKATAAATKMPSGKEPCLRFDYGKAKERRPASERCPQPKVAKMAPHARSLPMFSDNKALTWKL
jgi:hypothetical protein